MLKLRPNRVFLKIYFVKLKTHLIHGSTLNKLLRKQKPSSAMPQAIITNGKTITSPHQICNEMNIHFV